jgi:lipopolysaccharide transport system permease protein
MSRDHSSQDSVADQQPFTLIDAAPGWWGSQLQSVWEYRELLYFLVWRDLKVRYKQTVLGAGWAILQPLLTMVVFSAIFGLFAKIPSDGVPYPIFTFAALLPWSYFANSFGRAGNSLVGSANLITKVYFPRLIIPLAVVLAGLVDFAVAFVILLGMLIFYGVPLTASILYLPLFMLLALACALGVGLWLSALNVKYRDVGYLIPFLTQLWMYASPIAYPTSLIPEQFRLFYSVNPLVGVVEGFRYALLGTGSLNNAGLWLSIGFVLIMLVSGLVYFQRTEETFADVV